MLLIGPKGLVPSRPHGPSARLQGPLLGYTQPQVCHLVSPVSTSRHKGPKWPNMGTYGLMWDHLTRVGAPCVRWGVLWPDRGSLVKKGWYHQRSLWPKIGGLWQGTLVVHEWALMAQRGSLTPGREELWPDRGACGPKWGHCDLSVNVADR